MRFPLRLILPLLLCAFSCSSATVRNYTLEVVREYPHDTRSYTQGLFFHEGELYESTGQYGESTMRKVDLTSGSALRKLDFSSKYFVEGSVILNDRLYILTWTGKIAFVYDSSTLEYIQAYSYPREGWGLTTDGKSLIASDGSARLYYMSPEFRQEKVLTVKLNGRPVRWLNELEWIEGKIWANVYTTDMIVIINPSDGNVEAVVDCSGLLPDSLRREDTDVLNGIAYLEEGKRIFLTGKNWPRLYEVRLVEQK